MFLASQGMTWLAGETSIMGGEVPTGAMATRRRINKLLHTAHETARITIVLKPMEDPVFVTWHDAAWKVRESGGSGGGLILAMAARKIMDGRRTPVTVIQGASRVLPRVTWSSLGAEI